jgi:uncharacterized membrane protein YsdA (DUF1294 family)
MDILPIPLILVVWLACNVIAFLLFGIDKRRAKQNNWRISERTLIIAAFFGPLGALWGMMAFHHKTAKRLFWLVPVFLFLQLIVLIIGNLNLF